MKALPTLFETGAELAALLRLVETCDADIEDPEAVAVLEEWFREIETNQAAKLDNYISLIRVWEMEAAKQKEEAERFALAACARSNRVGRLKSRMLDYLELTQQKAITTERGRTVAAQNNGGVLPMILSAWVDELAGNSELMAKFAEQYPKFVKTTVTVDTAAIRAELDKGATLSFAALGKRGKHLRIR
jgi:hypothetical protein